MIASSSHDYDYVVVCVGTGGNASTGNEGFLIDIGTGAAASEVVVIEDILYQHSTLELGSLWFPIHVSIPSGTRISARCQSDTTNVSDRMTSVCVLGVKIIAPSGGGAVQTSNGFFC